MKILIAYYSRSGNNKKVAEEIADKIKATTDEIIPEFDYMSVLGFIRAILHVLKKKIVEVNSSKDPKNYDLVIVAGPMWMGSISPPAISYISKHNLTEIAFFSCCGSGKPQKAPKQLKKMEIKSDPTLFISEKELGNDDYAIKLKGFIERLR